MHTYQFNSYILIGVQIFTWNKTEKWCLKIRKQSLCYLISGHRFCLHLPSFNSPKFPQPIFLPTRKFGPTMRTPEELEEPDGRDECPLRLPWETLAALVGRSPYLSLCWSMAWAAQVSRSLNDVRQGLLGWAHHSHSPGHWQCLGGTATLMRQNPGTAGRHSSPVLTLKPLKTVRQHLSQEAEGGRPVGDTIKQGK